ncbi:MAG TPA: two-component regulator propeller domain-containing protein, partial [Acidobacteriaceae bacterium]
RTWFAPFSGGLYWLRDQHLERVTLAGLNNDVIYSIHGAGNEIWVGRSHGGLTALTWNGASLQARTFSHKDGLAQDSVYSVLRARDGTVWAGTVSAGVSVVRRGRVDSIAGGNGGFSTVNCILQGADGTVWFATPTGLDAFAGGRWMTFTAADGLPSSNVRVLYQDTAQVLWIATSQGLAYSEDGSIRVPRSLPDKLREPVLGITEDQHGQLWITTSDHVLEMDREKLLRGSLTDSDVRSFGSQDGLPATQGVERDRSVITDPYGNVWIGLAQGMAMTRPQLTEAEAQPMSARLEALSAGNLQLPVEGQPKIPAGHSSITFHFGAATLAAVDRARFRYRLEGADRAWSEIVAHREITYSNLAPGSYRFRIIASNAAGLWNGPEASLAFSITPSFWQTWWFRSLCAFVAILLVVLLYRIRMYRLIQGMNTRFQERLAERTRIAQDLHDTLLQGVISASMQLDVAEDQIPESSPAKPRVRRVLELMGQVTEEGRRAVSGLRSSEQEIYHLEQAFSRLPEELAIPGSIEFRVITESTARALRSPIRDEVYRIGREALVNAFQHAEPRSVEVEVEYARSFLRLAVRDDGCGIDPKILDSGRAGHWGLIGMRERSERIGGRLRLRSSVGAGTEVELTIPGIIAFQEPSPGPAFRAFHWNRRTSGRKDEPATGSEP